VTLPQADRDLLHVAAAIRQRVRSTPEPALLVAMSGVDGSGKSTLARRLARALGQDGLRVAKIAVDPWQNPQTVRFGGTDPGRHFYEHAIRFDDLFDEVVQPLVRQRSLHVVKTGIRTDADVYEPLPYDFDGIDVVLVEGIFLLQPAFDARYDIRVWVECSFETALQRALLRNAEGLPPARLRLDYEQIYHAAQRHHLRVDRPALLADCHVDNEGRLQ
jgi:uridine kinase